MFAGLADHLVAAGHEARCGRQRHAAGVFEAFARREHRLLPDHAFAAHFLLAAGGVGNDPVPRSQLHGLITGVDDDDGVGPEILTLSTDERSGRKLGSTVTSIWRVTARYMGKNFRKSFRAS